jgi:hypothetical protein
MLNNNCSKIHDRACVDDLLAPGYNREPRISSNHCLQLDL